MPAPEPADRQREDCQRESESQGSESAEPDTQQSGTDCQRSERECDRAGKFGAAPQRIEADESLHKNRRQECCCSRQRRQRRKANAEQDQCCTDRGFVAATKECDAHVYQGRWQCVDQPLADGSQGRGVRPMDRRGKLASCQLQEGCAHTQKPRVGPRWQHLLLVY